MKQNKSISIFIALLFLAVTITACSSSSNDDDTPTDRSEIQLNIWIEKENSSQYNYKEYNSQMKMEIIHMLEFTFNDNCCTNSYESVHFDNNSLRDTYLVNASDYHSGNTGYAIRDLPLFKNHTKEEVKAALTKGDYTGNTLVSTSKPDTPKYTVDQLYGLWVCVKSVGKYTVDNFTMTDVFTYEEGDTREMYEFSEDGTIRIWHAKSTQEASESYTYEFKEYSATDYGIYVKNGNKKKWYRSIDNLSSDRLVLYDSNYLHYTLGYTLTFVRVK